MPVNQGATFTININGAIFGVTYYYRCYAWNAAGAAWAASSASFTTLQGAGCAISNSTASSISIGSAQLNGSIVCPGAAFDAYAYWGPSDGAWINSSYAGTYTNYSRLP
jgi:hypothetical protein